MMSIMDLPATPSMPQARVFRHQPYAASAWSSDSEDGDVSIPRGPASLASTPEYATLENVTSPITSFSSSSNSQLPPPPPAYVQPAASPSRPSYRHSPYATSPVAPAPRVAHGISHQPLVGRCRFIAWPAQLAKPDVVRGVDPTLPRLVIEQVKFELTPSQLRWLIRELTTVIAVNVVELDRGSFAMYFANEQDMRQVQAVNRTILFDHNGAWAPADASESQAVARYMNTREFRQRGQRLPRELMAISHKVRRMSK